jgi:hypothetical protein
MKPRLLLLALALSAFAPATMADGAPRPPRTPTIVVDTWALYPEHAPRCWWRRWFRFPIFRDIEP